MYQCPHCEQWCSPFGHACPARTLDPDAEVEVIGVSTYGDYVCVKQGKFYFSVKVGNPDEPPEYDPVTGEEAEEIATVTKFSTKSGTASNISAVRRNIAPGRDELLDLYYRLNPEARAVRDYLEMRDQEIMRRVAECR